jgi:SAM-dependent methyltransferase
MSTPDEIFFSENIKTFYTNHLRDFGNSAKGVGWKNTDAQHIRFEQLAKIIAKPEYSLNDLGCGVGELYTYLQERNLRPNKYAGYDILNEMVETANQLFADVTNVSFKKIDKSAEMSEADYSVASGIFNVKYEASESQWLNYVLTTLDDMNSKSSDAFSFNLLTKYSDKEFMQDYLYYADPLFYFDYCKRNYSRNVALLHDYYQYDFTILVRKTQTS